VRCAPGQCGRAAEAAEAEEYPPVGGESHGTVRTYLGVYVCGRA
jgi:hypothetical protein